MITITRINILCLLLLLFSLPLLSQPVINSFSPASGPVGTVVTITGNNFNANPANNIVFFGAVRANISNSTATSLTVTVPAGTTYQPLTVTVGGLTGYSSRPFNVTFTGGILTSGSYVFTYPLDNVTGIETNDITDGDFDGDGKNDIAVVDRINGFMAVYKNTSTATAISFAPRINFLSGNQPRGIASGDIDGDGKPDIVVANTNDNNISVFRNTSTVGSISFAAKVNFSTAIQPLDISLADYDGDGKIDIATANGAALPSFISVLRNTGSTGVISFAPRTDIPLLLPTGTIKASDLNGDNKSDLVVISNAGNQVFVLTNTSTVGSVSFAASLNYATGTLPDGLTIGDMDGDNKPDMAYANFLSETISIYRNTSTGGVISFAASFDLSIPGADMITMTDADGDGKTDLAVQTFSPSGFSILKNNSSIGTISLGSAITFPAACSDGIIAGDWDSDGKSDIALGCGVFRVGIWKNKTTEPQITSFTPLSGITGTTVTITGVNFSGTASVSFGDVAASSFTVVNSTTITATVGAGASGIVKVISPNGAGEKDGFTYYPVPTITSFTPVAGTSGTQVTISGTNFTGATAVSFGGTPASSFTVVNSTTITATVGVGLSGSVNVTTPGGTATLPGFNYTGPVITSFTPNNGGTGTIITINGLNFTGAFSVSFGNVQALSFTVVNSTTITAIVATGANGNVTVTTGLGSFSLPGFTYTGPSISSFTPTSGNPGTVITITGNNFTGTTLVSFGGTPPASFTVVNSTTITATIGNGTSGSISVTTPLGNASIAGFTYTGPPVISSFTPVSAGSGSAITITGVHFTGTTSVSFGGTPASSYTIINPTTIIAVVGTGSSGNVSLTTTYGTATLAGFTYLLIPKINSVSPLSGIVGTPVTITGSNFSTVPANNIVYFGATRATVASASSTALIVNVPFGATYEPISAAVNGLTAYSTQPFIVTFNNNGIRSFSPASFAPPVNFDMEAGLRNLALSDIDSDGKPDITVVNINALGFSVLRSTSVSGNISFAPKVDFNINYQDEGIFIKDLDGDSKPDVIVGGIGNVSVSRNTSTTGNISFASKLDILPGLGAYYIYSDDLDFDGKPDIITANYYGESVSILRNFSTPGLMSFPSRIDISVSGRPRRISVSDIDGDSKPDIVISKDNPDAVIIYRNTSTIGNISFAPGVSFSAGQVPAALSVGDLDGDGKPDLATGNYLSANSTIFRNTSTSGLISFVTTTFNSNVGFASNLSFGDINGDGKPDMIISDDAFLNLFNNTSTAGNISFEPKTAYIMSADPVNGAIGDLDSDGRPDIASHFNSNGLFVSILRNKIGDFGITSFSPITGTTGTTITINGINLSGVTAVDFGGVAAASFAIVNSTTITAVVANGASGNVKITSPSGISSLSGFSFTTQPIITSFTPVAGPNGTVITIDGANFNGATAVSFGGVAASSFNIVSAASITAVVGAGASGNVSVTTPVGTATKSGFTFIPPPIISSFTPTSGTTSATITITGTNFTGATAVSFGGTAATSFVVNSSTTITAIVGAGTSGSISVTTPGGTASLSGFIYNFPTGINGPANNNSRELTIFPNPSDDLVLIKHPASAKNAQIRFIDMLGREVKMVIPVRNSKQTETSVKKLAKGIYQIIWSDGGLILSRTFMVK